MPTTTEGIVYALLPATVMKQQPTWVKLRTNIVNLGSVHLDGTPRRRLSNVRLAFGSFVIVDAYGYFIKRPSVQYTGVSSVRLFKDGVAWLDKVSAYTDEVTVSVLLKRFSASLGSPSKELSDVMQSNPTPDSAAFTEFLNFLLPKGLEVSL